MVPTEPPDVRGAMRVSPQEYVDVMNLYSLYNLSSDIGTPEEYAGCFTGDGVLQFDGKVMQRGEAQLVEYKRRDQDSRGNRYRRHWNATIHLEKVDTGEIRGRCYLQAFSGEPGVAPVLTDTAVYEDRITETNGEWRFASRNLLFDYRLR
jgi:SnoaL-like protein